MNWMTKTHVGRCFLHLAAVGLGTLHGHPRIVFHLNGIAREMLEFVTVNH